jgi:hypothetical protein
LRVQDEIRGSSVGCQIAKQLLQVSARTRLNTEQVMLTILLIVLVIALLGGGLGHSRYGYAGWSPAGIVVVVLLLLLFTGHRI